MKKIALALFVLTACRLWGPCALAQDPTIPPVPPVSCTNLMPGAQINGYWGNGKDYNHSTCRWHATTRDTNYCVNTAVCASSYCTIAEEWPGCNYLVCTNGALPMNAGCTDTPGPIWVSNNVGPQCDGPPGPTLASGKIDSTHLDQLKNDNVERDVPLPTAFSRFEILDVGKAGSPIRTYGTAYAYIKRFPSGNIMTWNEDTDLRAQNVSSKIITAMDLEIQSVSVDGTDTENTRHLILRSPLNPGESWNQPLNHVPDMRPKVKLEEFNKLTKMTPAVTAHVTSVTFSDGTTYKEEPSKAAARVPLKDQNVLP